MKLYTPFSTHLSGSAKETELRLRSIFQWKKKRPSTLLLALAVVLVLGCGGLVACRSEKAVPILSMAVQYEDERGNVVELPTLLMPEGREETAGVRNINQILEQMKEQYRPLWSGEVSATEEQCLFYPAEARRYLNLVFYRQSFQTDLNTGHVLTLVYDKKNEEQVTLEDALALSGQTAEELCAALARQYAPELEQQSEALRGDSGQPVELYIRDQALEGFRMDRDGKPIFYLTARTDDRYDAVSGADQLYIWADGAFTLCEQYNHIPVLVPAEEQLILNPPLRGQRNDSEIDRQLRELVQQREVWRVQDESEWWGYAVTDLDRNGRLELISSEIHGTGRYVTTHIFGDDGSHPGVTLQSEGSSPDLENMRKELSHGRPAYIPPLFSYASNCPAYYDRTNDVYYYIYEDEVREEPGVYVSTLVAWSLRMGAHSSIQAAKQGKVNGIVLGCGRSDMRSHREDYWDRTGNYISKAEYQLLEQDFCAGLEPLTAHFSWIEMVPLDDLDDESLFQLLKESMEGFSLSARPPEVPFDDIMGLSGVMEELDYASSPTQKHRVWSVQGQDGRNTIAESYGFGDEVYAITDLDGDGVTELLCEYTYGDGVETVYVYRRQGDEILEGTLSEDVLFARLPDLDPMQGAAQYQVRLDPDKAVIHYTYPLRGGAAQGETILTLKDFTFTHYTWLGRS